MSASVDQRSKGQVPLGSNKDPPYGYMQAQPAQATYAAGTSAMADPYAVTSYYPYYPMPDDMGAAGVWSSGDAASTAAMSYGYNALGADYGTMMTDYGYPSFGWFPGADGTAWGTPATVPATVKDDQGNTYAAASGYYAMEAVPMYGNASGPDCTAERDLDVNSVEQGMQRMNINSRRTAEVRDSGLVAANCSSLGSTSWASIAGQPTQPMVPKLRGGMFPRAAMHSGKTHHDSSTWESRGAGEANRMAHDGWSASRRRPATALAGQPISGTGNVSQVDTGSAGGSAGLSPTIIQSNQYNPKEFDLNPKAARFFIIKSYAEDDIHRSIKYGIWCSTEYGNKRLDAAFREREGKGPVYLFYSVNGSGHFCGVAQMMSPVDYQASADVWTQDKWKGKFEVKWIYVKDVPNSQLRHIRLENNEGKPVTNSRDTQEVPPEKGCQVLRVIHQYRHTTSIFDDFSHYEKRQEEDAVKK